MEYHYFTVVASIIALASGQCTLPVGLQNRKFRASSTATLDFNLTSFSYVDTKGPGGATLIRNFTCDGKQGEYYFGRYFTSIIRGGKAESFESLTCDKITALANDVFLAEQHTNDAHLNKPLLGNKTVVGTFASLCNTSRVVPPEEKVVFVRERAEVMGFQCPAEISGVFNYTLNPGLTNGCAGKNPIVDVCSTWLSFNTTKCAAAESFFGNVSQENYVCVKHEAGPSGLTFLTVVDMWRSIPRCIVYKTYGDKHVKMTVRETSCGNNQNDTWADSNSAFLLHKLEPCLRSNAPMHVTGSALLFLSAVLHLVV